LHALNSYYRFLAFVLFILSIFLFRFSFQARRILNKLFNE